nr:hypothetical protein [Paraburkholderia hiiakae]
MEMEAVLPGARICSVTSTSLRGEHGGSYKQRERRATTLAALEDYPLKHVTHARP